jgi:hypothetical protein
MSRQYDKIIWRPRILIRRRFTESSCLSIINKFLPKIHFSTWNHFHISYIRIQGMYLVDSLHTNFCCQVPSQYPSFSCKTACCKRFRECLIVDPPQTTCCWRIKPVSDIFMQQHTLTYHRFHNKCTAWLKVSVTSSTLSSKFLFEGFQSAAYCNKIN